MYKKRIHASSAQTAIELLAAHLPLSKIKLKEAMQKGAVMLKRSGHKQRRIRKAKFIVNPGDELTINYSEKILMTVPPLPILIHDFKAYSIWHKPHGMLTQGTDYGDHCSLERQTELYFSGKRKVKLVHRLDRDASGLVILAHTKSAAAKFAALFRNNQLIKKYYAAVSGAAGAAGETVFFNSDVNDKKSLTEVHIVTANDQFSELDITLHTGRRHQIRVHLSQAGYPILGDCLYGNRACSETNLQLIAYALDFICPLTSNNKSVRLPGEIFDSLKCNRC